AVRPGRCPAAEPLPRARGEPREVPARQPWRRAGLRGLPRLAGRPGPHRQLRRRQIRRAPVRARRRQAHGRPRAIGAGRPRSWEVTDGSPLGRLYALAAMVLAQVVMAFPIVAGLTLAAVQQLNPNLRLQLLALGASRVQLLGLLLREVRLPLLAAVMAGFGAVISEVGASLMVGGNIRHSTRVLTTATVLETGKGNFEIAIALSIILLAITFAVNWVLTTIQQRSGRR